MASETVITNRFADRVAVVTGAASGIGRATALRFLAEGATVILADINEPALEKTINEVVPAADRPRAHPFRCDVADEADHLRLRRWLPKEFGRFDVMVNAAGIGGSMDKVIHCRVKDFDRTQEIILRGVFLGIKHAALAMMQQPEGGAIVNISSVAGLCGASGGLAYSAAKAGVINLTQTSAVQLAASKIRVNVICPGWIMTPLITFGDPAEIRRLAHEAQPLPYPGEPEDIAGVVAFLASNDARFMTGATLVVDGGAMAEGTGGYSGRNTLGTYVNQFMGSIHRRHIDVPSGSE